MDWRLLLGLLLTAFLGGSAWGKPEAPAKSRSVSVTATLGKTLEPSKLITYKTVEKGRLPLTLHVFNPADWKVTDRRPVLVTFHGGGWTGGEPSIQGVVPCN